MILLLLKEVLSVILLLTMSITSIIVVDQYNQRCMFASNDQRLAYIVREPLHQGMPVVY